MDDFNLRMAIVFRLESKRFVFSRRQADALELVNALTTAQGRQDIELDAGWHAMRALAPMAGIQANHLAVSLRWLADDARRVLLPLSAPGGHLRLGINWDVESWRVTAKCTAEAHWRALAGAMECGGVTPWLLPPEMDLNDALNVTHWERWQARCGRGVENGLKSDALDVPNSGTSVPNSGAVPDLGTAVNDRLSVGGADKSSMFMRSSCAKENLQNKEGPRARARVDKLLIGNSCKGLTTAMSRIDLKVAISDGNETEFCLAARQIMGADDWDDGRPGRWKGDGAQWRMRHRHAQSRGVAIAVFLDMIETEKTGGGTAKNLWNEWGGRQLEAERIKNQGIF